MEFKVLKVLMGDGVTKISELTPIEVITESEVKIIRIGDRSYRSIFSQSLGGNIILEHIDDNNENGIL